MTDTSLEPSAAQWIDSSDGITSSDGVAPSDGLPSRYMRTDGTETDTPLLERISSIDR